VSYFLLTLSTLLFSFLFFFSSRRRHTRWPRDWSSDVCSSDLTSATRWGGLWTWSWPGREPGPPFLQPPNPGCQTESASAPPRPRSEERRVGKECRSRWSPDH